MTTTTLHLQNLITRLCRPDPLFADDVEGYICHFCGATSRSPDPLVQHKPDCAWFEAMLFVTRWEVAARVSK